jgi:hypothetical protein
MKTTTATEVAMATGFFIGTKFLVLDILPRGQKFSQECFLAMTALELSKENTNAKYRVGNNRLVVHIDKSIGPNERKIR